MCAKKGGGENVIVGGLNEEEGAGWLIVPIEALDSRISSSDALHVLVAR